MKAGRHLLGTGAIAVVAAVLIVLTWFLTLQSVRIQQARSLDRTEAALTGDALAASTQIERQIIAIDQMLSQMTAAWRASPSTFDVSAWRREALTVNGIARDVFVADETGTIRQATLPDAIGQGVGNQDFFLALSVEPKGGSNALLDNKLFLGAPTISPLLRQWHINAARALRNPDGSFAGTIDTDYRLDAITGVLAQAALGTNGLALVVSLTDGKLRGVVGGTPSEPDGSIGESPLFAALQSTEAGIWIGHSPTDAVNRILAFRRIPNWNLVVAMGMDEQEALASAAAWRRQAILYATAVTLLILLGAWMLVRRVRQAAQTAGATQHLTQAVAFATAQADVVRLAEERKREQLDTTLAGAGEGIAIIDGHLCLVDWNDRFCDLAGAPAEHLRAGMPLEEVIRTQIAAGSFGRVDDPDAEVAHRIARLRTHVTLPVRRQHPDGRTLEIRRRLLPDGGFVIYVTDATDLRRNEERLHAAEAAAQAAAATHTRFAAAAITALRASVGKLAQAMHGSGAASKTGPDGGAGPMGSAARRALHDLDATVDDIEDMARLTATDATAQPRLVDLRRFLDDLTSSIQASAAANAATFRCTLSPALPPAIHADTTWLGRLIRALTDFALSVSDTGMVSLDAGPGHSASEGVALYFRVNTARFPSQAMASLLAQDPPLNEPAQPPALRLALCQRIARIIGATLAHDPPPFPSDEHGISLTLSRQVLPTRPVIDDRTVEPEPDEAAWPPDTHRLPRTRILVVEDIPANQIVTATLLRREGHCVDIAASGEEAVAMAGRTPYDLIFMDVLMPGMDGPAASAAIHGLAVPACDVPIVALTADEPADPGSDPRMAVFDAILGKPVVLSKLLAVLESQIWYRFPHEQRPRDPLPPMPEDGLAAAKVLSAERLLELRGNLSADTFVSLIEECLDDLKAQVPALRQAVESGQSGPVVAQAHAMVGMAAGYGMAELEATLRTILNAARADDLAVLDRGAMADVDASLAATAKALREMMQDVVS